MSELEQIICEFVEEFQRRPLGSFEQKGKYSFQYVTDAWKLGDLHINGQFYGVVIPNQRGQPVIISM